MLLLNHASDTCLLTYAPEAGIYDMGKRHGILLGASSYPFMNTCLMYGNDIMLNDTQLQTIYHEMGNIDNFLKWNNTNTNSDDYANSTIYIWYRSTKSRS